MSSSSLAAGPAPATAAVERRLYLLRHAESSNAWGEQAVSSWSDAPLTEHGREQARALGELFAGVRAACVHASDIPRARETAEALASGRPVQLHEGLREVWLGELEGATAAALREAAPGFLADPEAAPPGGESFRQAAQRALPTLERVLGSEPCEDVVVVAHSAVNRGLIAGLLGLPDRAALRMRQDWACVNVLDHAAGRWWLAALNWTPAGVEELRLPPGPRGR